MTEPTLAELVIDKIMEYEILIKESRENKEDQNSFGSGYDSGYLAAFRQIKAFMEGEVEDE